MRRTGIHELKDYYHESGPRFWLTVVGLLAFIGGGLWLTASAAWPSGCDHKGRGLTAVFRQLLCSPGLLNGGVRDYAAFTWLWFWPAALVVTFGITSIGKVRNFLISKFHRS